MGDLFCRSICWSVTHYLRGNIYTMEVTDIVYNIPFCRYGQSENITLTQFLLFQFTYKADSNQLTFLQILSTRAEQTITYHCKNSAAYYHKKKKTYRYGIKLMAWNDLEILPKGQKRVRYEVIQDDCKVSHNLCFRFRFIFLLH